MLYLLEFVVSVTLVYLFLTQIIIPMGRGEPLLPLFWSKEQKLQAEAAKLSKLIGEEELADTVSDLQEKLKRKQSHKQEDKGKDESN